MKAKNKLLAAALQSQQLQMQMGAMDTLADELTLISTQYGGAAAQFGETGSGTGVQGGPPMQLSLAAGVLSHGRLISRLCACVCRRPRADGGGFGVGVVEEEWQAPPRASMMSV